MKTTLLVILCLLVIAGATMVMPVMSDGTSTITGNPTSVIDLRVTGNISGWVLIVGTNTRSGDADLKLNVSSTSTTWNVRADDLDGSKPVSTKGHMADWNGTGYDPAAANLTTPMTIIGESVGGVTGTAGVLDTGGIIETGSSAVDNQIMHPVISQPVLYTDTSLTGTHVYRIVVTFTGSPT